MIPALSGVLGINPAEWQVSGANPATGPGAIGATGVSGGSGASGGFGNALTSAIDALEGGQQTAAIASQGLATGQLTDPTQAITAVENASLEMDLASQIRTKLTDATTTIFGTQI